MTQANYPSPQGSLSPFSSSLFFRSYLLIFPSFFGSYCFLCWWLWPLSLLDSLGICVPGHQLWFLGHCCPIWCELYLGSYINLFFLMVQGDIWVELNSTLKITLHSTGLENIFHRTIFWASYIYYGLKTIKKGPLSPWEEDVAMFSDENERREHYPLWGLCYFSWGS